MLTGNDIYRRRTALRRTQNALATSVHVSAGHISNLENKQADLNRDLAVRTELVLRDWEGNVPTKEAAAYEIGRLIERLNRKKVAEALIFIELLVEEGND